MMGRRSLTVVTWSALLALSLGGEEWRRGQVPGGMTTRIRRLANCENINITPDYGIFIEDGERNDKHLYVSTDGSMELFFSEREDDDDDDGRRRNRLLLGEYLLEEDWEREGEDGEGFKRSLGECTGGLWSLAPAGDGYPRLVVDDCAEHPADIKVDTWSEVTCATCDEQDYSGEQPTVSCFYGDIESTPTPSTRSGSGSDSEGGDDDSEDGSSSTSSAVSEDDDNEAEGCEVLEVGGTWPGLYTVVGTYNGRGDYYSENVTHNIFFEFEEASSEEGGGDDDDDENSRRRRSLQGNAKELRRVRGLAACDFGYWIKMLTEGGYPFFAVADCAQNPEDISSTSTWQIVRCDGCAPEAADVDQTVICATGADAVVSTPSPVGPIVTEDILGDTLPGAGPSTCEAVTVTGPRGGDYTAVGERNNRPSLSSVDGNWAFFYAAAAPALERMRRRLEDEEGGDGAPLSRASQRRDLQITCAGYWYITPLADTTYPLYAVFDCAYHPVDIIETDWVYIECEDCEVETANPKPEASCTGAPENAKRGGSFSTPAPTPFDPNRTPAPIPSFVSTCTDLVVTGDVSGNYSANGTYRGKLDFFSENGLYNLYFEIVTARRVLHETGWDIFPGDAMASALGEIVGVRRNLALCSTGYWIIAGIGGDGYPVFGVPDCAEHPADIRSNPWLVISCESCGVQEAPTFVAPTVSCSEASSSTRVTDENGTVITPAPVVPATCGTVYVTGPAAGVYGQQGTYADKGDFYSNNRIWNMYWVFYAGKPENRNRFRRSLSMPEGVYLQGDNEGKWSEEHERALETLAAELRGQSNEVKESRRRLYFCEDGFWLITPRGGGFPFYGTQNCADHPADISTSAAWSVVECDGCGSEPLNGTIGVTCDGEGFTPPPSPTSTTPLSLPTPYMPVAPVSSVGDTVVGLGSLAPVASVGREEDTSGAAGVKVFFCLGGVALAGVSAVFAASFMV